MLTHADDGCGTLGSHSDLLPKRPRGVQDGKSCREVKVGVWGCGIPDSHPHLPSPCDPGYPLRDHRTLTSRLTHPPTTDSTRLSSTWTVPGGRGRPSLSGPTTLVVTRDTCACFGTSLRVSGTGLVEGFDRQSLRTAGAGSVPPRQREPKGHRTGDSPSLRSPDHGPGRNPKLTDEGYPSFTGNLDGVNIHGGGGGGPGWGGGCVCVFARGPE